MHKGCVYSSLLPYSGLISRGEIFEGFVDFALSSKFKPRKFYDLLYIAITEVGRRLWWSQMTRKAALNNNFPLPINRAKSIIVGDMLYVLGGYWDSAFLEGKCVEGKSSKWGICHFTTYSV